MNTNNFNFELFIKYLNSKPLNKKVLKLITDLEKYAGKPKEYYLALLANGKESINDLEILRNIRKEQANPNRKTYTTEELKKKLDF